MKGGICAAYLDMISTASATASWLRLLGTLASWHLDLGPQKVLTCRSSNPHLQNVNTQTLSCTEESLRALAGIRNVTRGITKARVRNHGVDARNHKCHPCGITSYAFGIVKVLVRNHKVRARNHGVQRTESRGTAFVQTLLHCVALHDVLTLRIPSFTLLIPP